MSKEKAIEICKNLDLSIENASKRTALHYNNTVSTNPSASVYKLKRKRDHIIEKFKLTKKDLK